MDLNRWHVSGTLCALRQMQAQNGKPYTVMTLSVTTYGRDGESRAQMDLTLFRELMEMARTFQHGDYILASGSFTFRERDGRTYTDLKVQDVMRLRSAQQVTPQQGVQMMQAPVQQGFTVPAAPQYQQPAPPAPGYSPDDTPF